MALTTLEPADERIRHNPRPPAVRPPTFSPQRMRVARQRAGMSFDDLSAIVGRNPRTVRRYESGQIVPPADAIGALHVALSVPLADLFE